MPGFALTAQQASRLLGVHVAICQIVLKDLVSDGVLYTTRHGTYMAAPSTRERA